MTQSSAPSPPVASSPSPPSKEKMAQEAHDAAMEGYNLKMIRVRGAMLSHSTICSKNLLLGKACWLTVPLLASDAEWNPVAREMPSVLSLTHSHTQGCHRL